MSKFITTTEIAYCIEKIIKEANGYIFIVTPFLKIPLRLKAVIEEKLSEIDSHFQLIIVGKEKDIRNSSPSDLTWLQSQNKIRFFNCNNLHAKCYLNEKEAIITSMNLWEYSFVNNIEFSFLIHKQDEHYRLILKEILKISDKDVIKKIENEKVKTRTANTLECIKNGTIKPDIPTIEDFANGKW